jgi:hypothetical protein
MKNGDPNRVNAGVHEGGQFKAAYLAKSLAPPKGYKQDSGAKEGGRSPWGDIQYLDHMAIGIDRVSTASHGGIKLSAERNRRMPDEFRQRGGWYEEDCEAAMPMWIFADELGYDEDRQNEVKDVVIHWFPNEYEEFTGEIIPPGGSRTKDERTFYRDHANDLICEWALSNGDGTVRVGARRGGRANIDRSGKTYLYDLPTEVYETRCEFGFVIDETQYEPIGSE